MRRPRLALGLALAALAAALVGAFAPAEKVRTTYTWPPADASGRDTGAALAHAAHAAPAPARVDLGAHGGLPRAARGAPGDGPRDDASARARRAPRTPTTARGSTSPSASRRSRERRRGDEACANRFEVRDGELSLERSGRDVAAVAGDARRPRALLRVDLERPPSIEITTAVHDVRPTLAPEDRVDPVAALGDRRRARARRVRASGPSWSRARIPRPRPVDAVVGLALLAWWIFSPAYWDDGWISARLASYDDAGGFSTYYDGLGANNPLGFWLDSIQRLFLLASDSLLVLRLPALLALAATWVRLPRRPRPLGEPGRRALDACGRVPARRVRVGHDAQAGVRARAARHGHARVRGALPRAADGCAARAGGGPRPARGAGAPGRLRGRGSAPRRASRLSRVGCERTPRLPRRSRSSRRRCSSSSASSARATSSGARTCARSRSTARRRRAGATRTSGTSGCRSSRSRRRSGAGGSRSRCWPSPRSC